MTSAYAVVVLSADAAVLRLFEALAARQVLALRHCSTAGELRLRCVESRPDVLVIDADIGHAATLRALRLVRETLCNDSSPVLLLGGDAALHQRLAQVLPGAVDYRLAKPLSEAALAEHQAALRRTVTLRRVSRSALDRVSEAVIVIDERGRIRSFNGAAEGLFQWSAREIVGRNVSMLVPQGHRERHDEYIQRYRRTGEARVIGIGRVEQAVRKDGSRFPVQLTVADISDGNVTRFVGVIRDLSLAQQRDELQNLVRHDSLTGLPNRAYVTEVLARSAQRWAGGGEPYSVLFCDVDAFKAINDMHGHHVGDEVLKAIALRLRKAVSEQDFVARLAGDEFIVVLHGVSNLAAAQAIGRRVAAAVAQPLRIGALQLEAQISIGAATPEDPHQASSHVIEQADRRMYEAKRARAGARRAAAGQDA